MRGNLLGVLVTTSQISKRDGRAEQIAEISGDRDPSVLMQFVFGLATGNSFAKDDEMWRMPWYFPFQSFPPAPCAIQKHRHENLCGARFFIVHYHSGNDELR